MLHSYPINKLLTTSQQVITYVPVQLLGELLLLNILVRESSKASTTARLSARFTRISSGSGRITSVISDTTIM